MIKIKHPTVGELYECVDICGMLIFTRKYIGRGRVQKLYPVGEWHDTYLNTEFYVFENIDSEKNHYKYAIAEPIFAGLEWAGYFKVTRYSNELEEIFNNRDITRFALINE